MREFEPSGPGHKTNLSLRGEFRPLGPGHKTDPSLRGSGPWAQVTRITHPLGESLEDKTKGAHTTYKALLGAIQQQL